MHRSFNMSIARLAAVLALTLTGGNYAADSFSTQPTHTQQHRCTSASSITHQRHHQCLQSIRHQKNHQSTTTALSVIGTGTASLLAGSLGGAIGVGVAYPLDTLKTKAQVYGQQSSQARKEQQLLQQQQQQAQQIQEVNAMSNSTAATMIPLGPPGTVSTRDGTNYDIESPEDDLISLVKLILEVEGIAGFFGGVKAMMIGQALIKSVAFSANQLALGVLNDPSRLGGVEVLEQAATTSSADEGASFVTLIMAASFAGFITSFLVAPVGKICFAYTCLSVGRSVNLFCQVSISQCQCNPISLIGVNIIWQSSVGVFR